MLVWLATHPVVWVTALGIVCSLLYRWLDGYPRAHAVFRIIAAALPGDVVAIRRAVLEAINAELARRAGVAPVDITIVVPSMPPPPAINAGPPPPPPEEPPQ